MSRVLTSADLTEQHLELLPARTVLSLFAQPASHGQGTDSGGHDGGIGPAVAQMLGFTTGGQSTAGPDGADGHPNHND